MSLQVAGGLTYRLIFILKLACGLVRHDANVVVILVLNLAAVKSESGFLSLYHYGDTKKREKSFIFLRQLLQTSVISFYSK